MTAISSVGAIPQTVQNGGTGVASSTAFSLIASGTTSTGSFQSVPTGTAGQVFVSGGAAALPSAVNSSTVGGYTYISTVTASNAANVVFTGLTSAYSAYKIIMYNVTSTTNAVSLVMRCSTNNGASYDSSANYQWVNTFAKQNATTSASAFGSSSDTFIALAGTTNVSNTSGQTYNAEVTFFAPATNVTQTFCWIGTVFSPGNGWYSHNGSGIYSTNTVNALALLTAAGNLNGTFKLYGIAAS